MSRLDEIEKRVTQGAWFHRPSLSVLQDTQWLIARVRELEEATKMARTTFAEDGRTVLVRVCDKALADGEGG